MFWGFGKKFGFFLNVLEAWQKFVGFANVLRV